jgi:putative SOS response-associated peptidase YedK
MTNDIFAFLTTDPNLLVGTYHPKAMPAILTTPVALQLQRPPPDDAPMVVVRGAKQDG